jgi:YrbI family 3-deoxy-D-manno-octulosonate 8-phosphate phosphatase
MNDVKLFLTDVDGCMTDGGMYYTASGDEFKRFCVYDGMGIVLLRKAGIPCGILTSEKTLIGLKRGEKLGLEYIYTGVGQVVDGLKQTKLDVAREICAELGITLEDRKIIVVCLNIPSETSKPYINWRGALKFRHEASWDNIDLYYDVDGGYVAKLDWENKMISPYNE